MHCTIIGTSNSVMKASYRPFLERAKIFEEVRNLSIGGTPNILLPYMIATNSLCDTDVVILETSVNDIWCIRADRLPYENIVATTHDVLDHLQALQITPILLLMPAFIELHFVNQIRAFYYDLEAMGKVRIVDGYPVLWALQEETGRPLKELFLDDGHVITPVAAAIANRLIDMVASLKIEAAAAPPRRVTAVPDFPYFTQGVAELAPQALDRENSLYARRYAVLHSDEAIQVAFEEEVQLLGFAFNTSGSSAVVEVVVDGGQPTLYDFRTAAEIGASLRSFTHALAPVPRLTCGRSIRIRVVPPQEVAGSAVTPLSHAKFSEANLGRLELESLILRKGRQPLFAAPVAGALPGPAQLSQTDIVLAQIIEAGRETAKQLATGQLFDTVFPKNRNFSGDTHVDLLRDIGRLAIENGSYNVARRCLSIAIHQRPTGNYIRALLEEASRLEASEAQAWERQVQESALRRASTQRDKA